MKLPSQKQKDLANQISRTLHIPPPTTFSAKAYWEFIHTYLSDAIQVWNHRPMLYQRSFPSRKEQRLQQQRDADWKARNLSPNVWARKVLDDEILPPSWCRLSIQEEKKRLRSLGYQSSLEKEIENLRDEWLWKQYEGFHHNDDDFG